MVQCLKAKVDQYGYTGEAEDDNPGVDFAEDLDGFVVLVVVQAEGLEDRGEGMGEVDEDDEEEEEVADDDMQVAELLAGHVIEVGLGVATGKQTFQNLFVFETDFMYDIVHT